MGKKQDNSQSQRAVAIRVYAQTDVGRARQGNEDNFLAIDTVSKDLEMLPGVREFALSGRGLTLMVSDGMGGAAAGEVASELAVITAMEKMPFQQDPSESEYQNRLVDTLKQANDVITEHGIKNPEMRGMGATATTAGILSDKVFIGQIGDSRAYLIRQKSIGQITKDQSFVMQLVESGKITEEEAAVHPRRNVILQALGNQQDLNVVMSTFTAVAGDYLLLCSDGLSGLVKNDEMMEIVLESADIQEACHRMVDLANARGGNDNITVVLGEFLTSDDATVSLEDDSTKSDEETLPVPVESQKPSTNHNPARVTGESDTLSDRIQAKFEGAADGPQGDGDFFDDYDTGPVVGASSTASYRVAAEEELDPSQRIASYIQKVALLGIIALILFSLIPCSLRD